MEIQTFYGFYSPLFDAIIKTKTQPCDTGEQIGHRYVPQVNKVLVAVISGVGTGSPNNVFCENAILLYSDYSLYIPGLGPPQRPGIETTSANKLRPQLFMTS